LKQQEIACLSFFEMDSMPKALYLPPPTSAEYVSAIQDKSKDVDSSDFGLSDVEAAVVGKDPLALEDEVMSENSSPPFEESDGEALSLGTDKEAAGQSPAAKDQGGPGGKTSTPKKSPAKSPGGSSSGARKGRGSDETSVPNASVKLRSKLSSDALKEAMANMKSNK
jgi:hypothetical protein